MLQLLSEYKAERTAKRLGLIRIDLLIDRICSRGERRRQAFLDTQCNPAIFFGNPMLFWLTPCEVKVLHRLRLAEQYFDHRALARARIKQRRAIRRMERQ
jgi:hypothetical protein